MNYSNRTKGRLAQKHEVCGCVLCNPPNPEQRGLTWKGYTLWPNVFPYLPAESEPVVISSSRHTDQRFDAVIMRDMIDYQSFAGPDVTMFYHHWFGNSEPHLHWHATKYTMPVEGLIDDGVAARAPVRQDADGTVETFDDGTLGGLLLTGDREYVARWAARVVSEAEADPNGGGYNLMLLPPRNGQLRLAVMVRRKEPRPGEEDRIDLGAPELAGTFVMPVEELPPDALALKLEAVEQNLVRPRELSFLDRLAARPDGDWLSVRLR